MSITALIKFTQGSTTAPAGQALVGVTGSGVQISLGGDVADAKRLVVEILDVPSTSALGPVSPVAWAGPPVYAQDSAALTYNFTPDTSGTYYFHIIAYDSEGNKSEDFRAFLIAETSGRFICGFRAPDSALNADFGSGPNTRGWAALMESYLRAVDSGGGGSVPWATYDSGSGDLAFSNTNGQWFVYNAAGQSVYVTATININDGYLESQGLLLDDNGGYGPPTSPPEYGALSVWFDGNNLNLLTGGQSNPIVIGYDQLGFFGVPSVPQQTGGPATAGSSYTSTEQDMINAMYTAMQAYGLLT
jgi:hypothetical protein